DGLPGRDGGDGFRHAAHGRQPRRSPGEPRGARRLSRDGALRMSAPAIDLLAIDDLHAGYGKAEVLAGLALRAAPGSVVTVIGPNGARKSTMLKAIMGVLPARGRLLLDGDDIRRGTLADRVIGGLALVRGRRGRLG